MNKNIEGVHLTHKLKKPSQSNTLGWFSCFGQLRWVRLEFYFETQVGHSSSNHFSTNMIQEDSQYI